MSDEKESIHRDSLSVSKGPALEVDDQFAVRLPESLANLTEAEREAVAKSGTRKVDIMLIPGRRCHLRQSAYRSVPPIPSQLS